MKKLILLVLALFSVIEINAQANKTTGQKDWRELMQDPNANFYDVQKAANAYWETHDKEEKGSGYKPYKRWEAFMEPRVYPTGDMYLPSQAWKNYETYLSQNNSGNKVVNPNMIASSTWTAMGPFGALTGSACGLPRKAGRDNFITFHPTVSTTYWVGAPAGGLWKTTNDGASWTTNTDNLSVIGCSDLAIDPTNTNIMYMATGDGDAGDTYCIGVLKSTDGGTTWLPTGLVWTESQQRMMRRLIIDPSNPQVLIAASSAGIWRTANGGTTWTQVSTINAYDVEFKPAATGTVYATSNTAFYRSVNNGTSWTVVNTGIPTTGFTRLATAVTTADPNYVYVLCSNASYGFGGLYRSTNSATSFTLMSNTPDVLANSCVGTSGNGQGWYDLALAVSPLNRDEVMVGGVNHWQSTNGGSTWTCNGCWNSTGLNPSYVHADVHEIEYNTAGVIYSANDGGIYKYNGSTWTDLSSPRNIAQQYRIGLSGTTADYWITGHQDNGSNIHTPTTYSASYCGDGMDCFIDRTNNMNVFSSTPNGGYRKSTNGGITWANCVTGLTGGTYWVSPWKQDPVSANVVYGSRLQLWRSTNQANTWAQCGNIPGNAAQGVIEFAIAPSNPDVIYVIHGNTGVYKTTNASAATPTWAATGALPGVQATYIAIKSTDPNTAWVTFSGYTGGTKVYKTINGGTTWTNVSTNLPNLPANCIVYEPGSNDRVYVGMDVGVYYLDNSTTNWTLYNAGLPNTPISDLEISPINPTKLYAATYGRGVYKVDVVTSAAPVSSFSVASTGLCSGTNVSFTDQSANSPTSWSWSVTPSVGVTVTTPTLQNPTMNFTSAGTYTVSMQATNVVGPGSVATQTVVIAATPTVNVTSASQTVCAGSAVSFTAAGATTYSWTSGGGTGTIATYTPSSQTVYTVTGTTSGCSGVRTATVYVNATPTLAVTGATTICNGNSTTLTGSGASTYTWSTGPTTTSISVSPTITTSYSVVGTGTNGCTGSTTRTVNVNPTPTITTSLSSSVICSGSNANLIASGASTYTWMPGSLAGATVSASPTVQTTYTVTGTDVNGCTNTAIRTVSINSLPTITAATSQSVICAGQSATLTGSGGSTYTWNPGAVTGNPVAFTPTATITYSVVGTGTNGCTNSAVRTITVNSAPTINTTASAGAICLGQTTTLTASGASTYSWNTGPTTPAISVSPTITTTYSVVGTGTNGCTGSSVRTVTVNSTPTVITIASASVICAGQTTTLTASGATTYSWSTGATTGVISVSPTITTTYSVAGTSTAGCSGNSVRTITVNNLPTISATPSSTLICTGQTATITASGASTYTWMPGSGTGSSLAVSPTVTTTYSVTGTATTNCSNSSLVTLSVSACTGIGQVVNTGVYSIFPNPTSGKLTIEMGVSNATVIHAEVVDASGKLVLRQQLNFNVSETSQIVNISGFANGLYFIKLTNAENKTEVIKVIKE